MTYFTNLVVRRVWVASVPGGVALVVDQAFSTQPELVGRGEGLRSEKKSRSINDDRRCSNTKSNINDIKKTFNQMRQMMVQKKVDAYFRRFRSCCCGEEGGRLRGRCG